MNTPEEDDEPTIKGINAADLLARGLESAKAATGNPQAWQPPTPEELAALLPQYEIESLLGRGGMGAVYRGKQAALDRAVAIKLLPAELAADAEFMSRFQREARTLAKLQHPGIVAVHDFGQTSQGHLYFVMEFVNGTDLSRLIHGPGVNAAQALEIITQVCEALQYAHGQGVIHRDIKPANVLINQEGRAKLADFGLARPTSEETASLTRSNVVMGTPDYMAPEQMAGNADHRADLYALGVMLYEMLTGQTPRGAWAPPSQRVQVDVRLDQVVVRALQQDPAMRYQQASEIKTDVDVIRTTPLPKAGKAKIKLAAEAPGQRTTPLPKQKKPANKLAIAAAIVLPLLAVAGWWVVQQRPESMSSNLPWQRIELSAEEWMKAGLTLKDGWVHNPGRSFILFDRLSAAKATSKFAVRAKVKFHSVEDALVFANNNGGSHTWRKVQFWSHKQSIINADHGPSDTQRHVSKVELDEEASVELLFAGDKVYTRFNKQPVVSGNMAPVIPWERCFLLGASYSLRDIEYAILDGIPDPLKALGWEVPQSTPKPSLPWQKLTQRSTDWDDKVFAVGKDGWISFNTPSDTHYRFSPTAEAPSNNPGLFKDVALRVRFRWNPEARGKPHVYLAARTRKETGRADVMLNSGEVQLRVDDTTAFTKSHTLSQGLQNGQEGSLELAVIEQRMIVRLNDQVVLDETHAGLNRTGSLKIGVLHCSLRDIEHVNLEGVPDPLKALGWEVPQAIASSVPWTRVERTAEQWAKTGQTVKDGWVHNPGKSILLFDRLSSTRATKQFAFRTKIIFDDKESRLSLANTNGGGSQMRAVAFWPNKQSISTRNPTATQRHPTTVEPGDEAHVEILVAGDKAYTRFNHGTVVEVDLSPLIPWELCYLLSDKSYSLRDTEYAILDGLPDPLKALGWEAGASHVAQVAEEPSNVSLAAATKDAPFVNTLGMKFVPVLGTDILMCIHETRRRDYGVFAAQAAEISPAWKNNPYGAPLTDPDNHPVVRVGWDDAKAFCDWLSKKEGRSYRLPTDREWSFAVGLGPAEKLAKEATPESRGAKFQGYPWGETWPPPKNAANLADMAWKAIKPDARLWIEGYDDGYATTAPVMSFEPNNLGIFDLIGNAAEWCEDWFNGEQKLRFRRGGAFTSSRAGEPGSSTRFSGPVYVTEADGFRCVVEVVDSGSVSAVRPAAGIAGSHAPSAATKDGKAISDAKKQLLEARAHLKAGDPAVTLELLQAALQTAPEDLSTMADAALLYAEAQSPERALTLAHKFVGLAPAEHPKFAAITELRVTLMPKMKDYRARLDAAAKLVTANDDAGELRELQAALKILPDGREAADRLEKNPLHVGRALPGRRWAGALGHTYVPVDGLPNVLFSTWEARVKDFEQFVKETGHDMSQPRDTDKALTWQKPGFEQTGDHPVVLVSREDARDFCDWITKKERAAGRLLPGQLYRLPTDREWSAAMGVLNEPGEFPSDRVFPEDIFTWKKDLPPPRNAENLNWDKDDFQSTAPVGSGIPNRFGIHDLLGNVMEICADPWGIMDDHGHDAAAVLRGSAYNRDFKVQRMRIADVHSGRRRVGLPSAGFRCVLDLKSEAQRAIQTQMEEAVAKLRALDAGKSTPTQEVNTLVNDEMVLMDLRRWGPLNELESTKLAGLPLTHLMAYCAERQQSMAVLKTFPLKAVRLSLEASENTPRLIENLRGLPLTHVNLSQHPSSGMPTKSLEALSGTSLRQLHLGNFSKLQNIEPLRGMPLEVLVFSGPTGQIDLSPVKDAPIRKIELPSSISLAGLQLACDWWAGKAQSMGGDGVNTINRFLSDAALMGDPAKVAEMKQTLMAKFASMPSLKFWTGWLNDESVIQSLDSCTRAARLLSGDATAFDGQFHTFQEHAYLWWNQTLTLDEAKFFAAKLGGHVVSITSQEENDFIIRQMEAGVFHKDCALGLERTGTGRMGWKWVTGEPLEYHNWGPESGTSSTAAVFVHDKGQWLWLHQSKNDLRPFIIEWDTPTPQPPVKK